MSGIELATSPSPPRGCMWRWDILLFVPFALLPHGLNPRVVSFLKSPSSLTCYLRFPQHEITGCLRLATPFTPFVSLSASRFPSHSHFPSHLRCLHIHISFTVSYLHIHISLTHFPFTVLQLEKNTKPRSFLLYHFCLPNQPHCYHFQDGNKPGGAYGLGLRPGRIARVQG